jgi:hypothetical protein
VKIAANLMLLFCASQWIGSWIAVACGYQFGTQEFGQVLGIWATIWLIGAGGFAMFKSLERAS